MVKPIKTNLHFEPERSRLKLKAGDEGIRYYRHFGWFFRLIGQGLKIEVTSHDGIRKVWTVRKKSFNDWLKGREDLQLSGNRLVSVERLTKMVKGESKRRSQEDQSSKMSEEGEEDIASGSSFGREDEPEQREEIAKTAAQDAFQIPITDADRNALLGFDPSSEEGKKFLGELRGSNLSHFLKKFDPKTKTGMRAHIELAKQLELFDIRDFGFDPKTNDGRKALLEIAKVAEEKNDAWFYFNIKDYGFDPKTPEGREALFEIAMSAKYVSSNIKFFGFDPNISEERKVLLEIAKSRARKRAWEISFHIQDYGFDPKTIEGREALSEISNIVGQDLLLKLLSNKAKEDGRQVSLEIHAYGIDANTEEGQKALFEIAKIAVENNPKGTLEHLHNYGFNPNSSGGVQKILAIASKADCDPNTLKGLKTLLGLIGKIDQKIFLRLLRIALSDRRDERLFAAIQEIGHKADVKEGRAALFEIAKAVAEVDGEYVSESIQRFGFDPKTKEGRDALFEIAKIAIENCGNDAAHQIRNYGFDPKTEEGQKMLVELAKLASSPITIKYFGFDSTSKAGQEILFELAKIAAAKSGSVTSAYIGNYGFDPETEDGRAMLFEIAKIAVNQNGARTSEFIQNYRFDPKTEDGKGFLVKLANMAALGGSGLSVGIRNFGFDANIKEDRELLVDLAKRQAARDVIGVCEHIENYGFDPASKEGRAALLEIAEECGQFKGDEEGYYSFNFGFDPDTFEGREAIDILSAIFEEDALCAAILKKAEKEKRFHSENIQHYGFDPKTDDGRKALIAIAEAAAELDGRDLSKWIKNYSIDPNTKEGQEALFEIAKTAARQNGEGTLEYLHNYGFDLKTHDGVKSLRKIAKIAGYNLEKMEGIKAFLPLAKKMDRELFLTLFKVAFGSDKQTTLESVKESGLDAREDHEMLLNMAKITAEWSGNKTSQYIQNFGFDPKTKEGEEALFEIAKIAAKQNGWMTLEQIKNYGFDPDTAANKQRYLEIVRLALESEKLPNLHHIRDCGFDEATFQEIEYQLVNKVTEFKRFWGGKFCIIIPHTLIEKEPLWCLERFNLLTKCPLQYGRPSLKVNFFDERLVLERGIDQGGLRRQFVGELIEALLKGPFKPFYQDSATGLYTPDVQTMNKKSAKGLMELGAFWFFLGVYNRHHENNQVVLGRLFDESIFKALFQFELKDLVSVELPLNPATKLAIAKTLVFRKDGLKLYQDRIELYERLEKEEKEEDLETALNVIETAGLIEAEYWEDETLLKDKVKKAGMVLPALLQTILPGQIEALRLIGSGFVKNAGLIAVTPKAEDEFLQMKKQLPNTLSKILQGVVTREEVANCLDAKHVDNPEVLKKVAWLKEWLLSKEEEGGASDKEIEAFLIFATGGSAIAEGQKITIEQSGGETVLPIAHTCVPSIDLTNFYKPGTQEEKDKRAEFLAALKEGIQTTGFDFQ